MLIAGDFNADLAVIPCLAKGIFAEGLLIWLLLILWVLVLLLLLPVGLIWRVAWVRVETFLLANALAASDACFVRDRWFTPHVSVFARFRIDAWLADVACLVVCQPVWPACWLDVPDRSSSSSSRVVHYVWDVYRDLLEVVPDDVVLALRDVASRSSVDDFWSIWSGVQRMGCSVLILGQVDPPRTTALLFLVEVCFVFVAGVWQVELLVAVALVGCIGSVMGIRLMCIVLC